MAGNYQRYGLKPGNATRNASGSNRRSVYHKRGRKSKTSAKTVLTVLLVAIILLLIAVYIFFNDVKAPVIL